MPAMTAKDIMHPRLSLPQKEPGHSMVNKLLSSYPGLPVVNEEDQVVGIVTEYDVFDALMNNRTVHEFSAESIMGCGHMEHEGVCNEPRCVSQDTPVDKVLEIMYKEKLSILPVVKDDKGRKLVGIIARKNIISALAERNFWPEHEFQKRV
ncbi:MAG: CBS domain-containing protein [Nitrospiraceae bacterium]|nr:CBS domain-containing protein [Nitrospiraceae bacterium]